MKEWSNLPNAKHIDWVIQSIKDNPDGWVVAWDLAWDATKDEAYYAARVALTDAVTDKARDPALDAAKVALTYAVTDAAYASAWLAASDAILALIAYDDIEHYFLSSHEELRLIYGLTQHPGAILLLPAVKARELIEAKNE